MLSPQCLMKLRPRLSRGAPAYAALAYEPEDTTPNPAVYLPSPEW